MKIYLAEIQQNILLTWAWKKKRTVSLFIKSIQQQVFNKYDSQ